MELLKHGHIRLPRLIFNTDLFLSDKFTRSLALLHLASYATYKPRTIRIRGVLIDLERGQLALSIKSLASRWNRNERTTRSFLEQLAGDGWIRFETSNVTTIITILNYDLFQRNAEQNTKQTPAKVQSKIHTNNKDKNLLNKNSPLDESEDPVLAKKKREKKYYEWLRNQLGERPDFDEIDEILNQQKCNGN